MPRIQSLLAVALSILLVGCAEAEPESLTIGSTAPPIDVDHWFALGEASEGEDAPDPPEPITDFESGEVYVVEFWATWCGPCVTSIPYVHDLQERFRDRGVTVMSISDEDVETIEPFFEREVINYEGDAEETPEYGELMAAYRVGSDPDRSVSEAYMKPTGQNGIPCAFIVGKTGKLEWVGHPMAMDEVLAAVVDDSWDREAFAEEFKQQQEMQRLQTAVFAAIRGGRFDEARELAAELGEVAEEPMLTERLSLSIDYAEFLKLALEDPEAAKGRFADLVEAFDSDPARVNELAWRVYQISEQRSLDEGLVKAVAQAAEDALDPEPQEPTLLASLLDTAAHLRGSLGQYETAIALQQRAVEASEPLDQSARQQMAAYLEQLQAEREQAESDDEPAASF